MGEIWRLWSAVWLGLPLIQTKSSVLWQMPKSNKARYTENIEKYTADEKNAQYTVKQMMPKEKNFFYATKGSTEKQQKTSVGNKKDIEKGQAEKTGLMQQVFVEKGQMEKGKSIQPVFVKKEQEEKGKTIQQVFVEKGHTEKGKWIQPVFVEKRQAEKGKLMQPVFSDKGQMEKGKWIQPVIVEKGQEEKGKWMRQVFVEKKQEEKGMSMQPVFSEKWQAEKGMLMQPVLMRVTEREKQKETPIFSMVSQSNIPQRPKEVKTEIWKNSGETKQMLFLQNQTKQNAKQWQTEKIVPKEKAKVTQFLHLAEHENVLQPQTEQPKIDGKMSEIWKQQGEDVVMLQKILRHYENQQNYMAGNQNVSIQIGHIKQEADVDDVMEALTKKLWEARSMTTKKPKGSV